MYDDMEDAVMTRKIFMVLVAGLFIGMLPGAVFADGPSHDDYVSPYDRMSSGSSSTVVMRKGAKPSEAPAAPPEPAMDMIMQTDGTMKLEPRRGNKEYIVASAGYGRNKKGTSVKGKQSDLIYAAEENKKDPAKK